MPSRSRDEYAGLPKEEILHRLREAVAERERFLIEVQELRILREEVQSQQEALVESQRLLEASRDRYADLYDFAPAAYLTLDGHGLIREMNVTAIVFFGCERGTLLDRPLLGLVLKDDAKLFLGHMRRCRDREDPVRTELRLRVAGREQVPVELLSRPTRESENGPHYRTVILDLTARLLVEEQRRSAEEEARNSRIREVTAMAANEAKTRFMATLSHELRAPLAPVLAAVESMQGDAALTGEVRKLLSLIARNVRMEARLLDDLLDVTRIERGKLQLTRELIDLHALAQEAIEESRESADAKGIRIEMALAAPKHDVEGDRFRLKQVIRNLLDNAIKFTSDGGRVALATDSPRPDWVRLEVSDNGRGLKREDIERIFEPFVQTRPEERSVAGLGLGLAICKDLIKIHGGHIQAYSAGLGKGARFSIELALPRRQAPQRVRRPPALAPAAARGTVRVLLVDDHPDTAESLQILLERHGFQVRVARCVKEAVEEAKQSCDLLISDLQLPDGSGHDIVRTLSKPVPAIALSGFGSADDVRRSHAAGFSEHLVKPVPMTDLLAAIERALTRAPLPGAARVP